MGRGRFSKVVSVLVTGIIAMSGLPCKVLADVINAPTYYSVQSGLEYEVTTNVTSSWINHTSVDFVVSNTGDETIHNWYLTFNTPYRYFQTFVDGQRGGRYVDLLYDNVAYESKVGYTCLSQRIRIQILKDAWLLENGQVDEVIWVFYRSEITGRIGASQELLDFLVEHGIEYIFME